MVQMYAENAYHKTLDRLMKAPPAPGKRHEPEEVRQKNIKGILDIIKPTNSYLAARGAMPGGAEAELQAGPQPGVRAGAPPELPPSAKAVLQAGPKQELPPGPPRNVHTGASPELQTGATTELPPGAAAKLP